MALKIFDRVKETTSTTGTGTITLAGAVTNFETFASNLSDGDTTYYAIVDGANNAFEVGLGTFTASGTTLARTTIIASSNSNNAVDLAAGTKEVFITVPADKMIVKDANGDISVSVNTGIILGSLMATFMAANVWFIIWPNQKKVISGASDAAEAGAKAGLASRTNTLLSFPMLYLMVYSAHAGSGGLSVTQPLLSSGNLTGFWIGLVIILLIELNAIFGKMNPMIASVKAVIHSGLALGVVFALLVNYL